MTPSRKDVGTKGNGARQAPGMRAGAGTAERPQLVARLRTITGSRAVRRIRREGFVPGVLYGKAVEPTPIMMSRPDLLKFLHAHEHGLLTLRVESEPAAGGSGGKAAEKPVLIKHIAHHPVDGQITHIDFQAIVLTEHIRVKVPLILKGDPVGVKQDGGVLEHFLRDIEVECLPTQIPNQVEHEVSAMKIGDSIHVRDLAPSAGARITADPEGVVASVLAPKEEKLEEAAAEAVTEPEVIREKKPEAEEAAAEGKEQEEKKAEKPEKAEKKEKEEK